MSTGNQHLFRPNPFADAIEIEGHWYQRKQFKRVYSGGHHEVYCNGASHITMSGDWCGSAPLGDDRTVVTMNATECDCARYK